MKILLIPEGLFPLICSDLNDAKEKIAIYRATNKNMTALYAEYPNYYNTFSAIQTLKFKSI